MAIKGFEGRMSRCRTICGVSRIIVYRANVNISVPTMDVSKFPASGKSSSRRENMYNRIQQCYLLHGEDDKMSVMLIRMWYRPVYVLKMNTRDPVQKATS